MPVGRIGVPIPIEDYAHDPRGNRISRTDRATGDVETYSYDSQNRLIGWTDGVSVISYAYDALDPNREVAELLEAITTGEGLSRDAGERIAEAIEGRTQGDAEDFLDRLLRDGLGWERLPARNDLGDRWINGRGGMVKISSGYPDGNFTGPPVKAGPNAIIRIGGTDLRVGLQ
ncbi:hypothetical protein [Boseongicola sp. H5]|uniref:hypothetical protein n=1 Tax=Boseongicola sp. H5 TaxID=2763261 RepID=UPI001D0B816F|nr:hypothetical protein [Boseongicola sp. H5]